VRKFENDMKYLTPKSSTFWYIRPCSLLKVTRSFGVIYHINLQGGKIIPAGNQHEAVSKQSCCYGLVVNVRKINHCENICNDATGIDR
jgi:hypothetical protein